MPYFKYKNKTKREGRTVFGHAEVFIPFKKLLNVFYEIFFKSIGKGVM